MSSAECSYQPLTSKYVVGEAVIGTEMAKFCDVLIFWKDSALLSPKRPGILKFSYVAPQLKVRMLLF